MPTTVAASSCRENRGAAFPLNELRTTIYFMVAISLGGTLWLLEEPGRIWPWFPVLFAVLGAWLLVAVSSEDGAQAVTQALLALAIVSALFWYAGEKLLALGYPLLRWACWAAIGAHAVNILVWLHLAGTKKQP